MANSDPIMIPGNPGIAPTETGWLGFVERRFERLLQVLITVLVLIPAWYIIITMGQSQPHLILGTNVVSAVIGFWIGSSYAASIRIK